MNRPLSIDYQPLDISSITNVPQLYLAAQKARADIDAKASAAETQRKYAENQDKKMSADLARSQWEMQKEYSDKTHAIDVEASNAAMPDSPIMRAGAKSAAQGNAVGKPYGISFEEKTVQDPAPNADPYEDPNAPQSAQAAKFLQSGGMANAAPSAEDMSATNPLQGPTASGAPLNEQAAGPETAAPDINVDAAIAAREPPSTRHVYSTFRGQTSEVKPPSETGLGERYDAVFRNAAAHVGEAKAYQLVMAMAEKENHDASAGTVAANKLAAHGAEKAKYSMTADQQLEDKGLNRGQSDTNSRRAAWAGLERAKIMAAGMGGGGGMPDPKIQNAYYGQSNRAFTRSGAKIDAAGMRMHDRMAADLEKSDANPYAAQALMHSLTASSLSSGSGAARVLKVALEDMQHSLPLFEDIKNTIHRKTLGGNTEEVQGHLREMGDLLRQLGHEQAKDDVRSWAATAGPLSQFGKDQRTRAMTFDEAKSVGQALGLSEDEVLDIITSPPEPGAAPVPAAAPGAPAHHRHSQPVVPRGGPPPQQGGGMIEVTNQKTGEKKMVTPEQARAMGAQ